MGAEERQILFLDKSGVVVRNIPLDSYRAGDIQQAREELAQQMNMSPESIGTKITGLRHGRRGMGSLMSIQLIDDKAVRDFFGIT